MSKPKKNLIDLYLAKIFENFIALKDSDTKIAQDVFKSVFDQVKDNMGKSCNYFQKYSSQTMYAGSVYDGIKVSKLDEFDMDIVIRLPICYDDGENGITIENADPGFIKMKIRNAFDNLMKQPHWENCHVVTLDWRDNEKYLLQNKFRFWIQGVVQKAVAELGGQITVNGVIYDLKYTQSGPAFTLKLRNKPEDQEFVLDVDLVPVIRFRYPRWPEGYRKPNAGAEAKDWLVVPKPNKSIKDGDLQNQCWRLSFQDFEKELMKGCQNLKTTIRLVKKMRDVLKLEKIASYYIKTLFLWKITEENSKKYWETKLSILFKTMVQILHDAIAEKRIPYFWNEGHNLIDGLKDSHRDQYVADLKNVLDGLENNVIDKVLHALLTPDEFIQFEKFDFYRNSGKAVAKHVPKSADRYVANLKPIFIKIDLIANEVKAMGEKIVNIKESNELLDQFMDKDDEVGMLKTKLDMLIEKVESMIKMDKMDKNKLSCIVENVNKISDEVETLEIYSPKRILLSLTNAAVATINPKKIIKAALMMFLFAPVANYRDTGNDNLALVSRHGEQSEISRFGLRGHNEEQSEISRFGLRGHNEEQSEISRFGLRGHNEEQSEISRFGLLGHNEEQSEISRFGLRGHNEEQSEISRFVLRRHDDDDD